MTRDEMAEIDRRASDEFGIPSLLLMENAGLRASDVVRIEFANSASAEIVVICGRGNNGGDGFVAARHLLNAGLPVRVVYCGAPDQLFDPGDPGTNAAILAKMGHPPRALAETESLRLAPRTLVVDAIFGTGLRGDVRAPERKVIEQVTGSPTSVVSIDIPSGLDADRGTPLGVAVRADVTVTLALPKRGFFVGDGPAYVGRLVVVDISVPRSLLEPYVRR